MLLSLWWVIEFIFEWSLIYVFYALHVYFSPLWEFYGRVRDRPCMISFTDCFQLCFESISIASKESMRNLIVRTFLIILHLVTFKVPAEVKWFFTLILFTCLLFTSLLRWHFLFYLYFFNSHALRINQEIWKWFDGPTVNSRKFNS